MESKNIAQVKFLDLNRVPNDPVPGNFILEIHFKPSAEKITTEWNQHVFGDAGAANVFPGCNNTYLYPEANPPFEAFQIRDYSDSATENGIKQAHGGTIPADFELEKKVQLDLKNAIVAPTVATALMSLLRGKMLRKNEISEDDAINTLRREFKLGEVAADGLLRRTKEYILAQEKQVS